MRTIAIFGNSYQGDKQPAVSAFIDTLSGEGLHIVTEQTFRDYLLASECPPSGCGEPFSCPPPEAYMAIAFGGDGTFLSAAACICDRQIPILGVNTGHLGFLAGANVDDAPAVARAIKDNSLIVERRTMLQVSLPEGTELDGKPYALNEIAILKRDSASMIEVNTALDGVHLARYQADGLIIATPTGSTAYNLSVGGPIVDPESGVWVISPVAPHTLTMRPLVIKDSSTLTAIPDSRTSTFRLSLDGRSASLPTGTELTISRAPFDTLLMRMPGNDFLDTLRNKLLWGK